MARAEPGLPCTPPPNPSLPGRHSASAPTNNSPGFAYPAPPAGALPAPGGRRSPPSQALRRAPRPAHARRDSRAAFHFPQKYPAPRPAARPARDDRAQVRATYPTPAAGNARPDLPCTDRAPRRSTRPGAQVRPAYPTPAPPGPSPGDRSPPEEPPLRRSQPVGRAIGEIEAKDGLPSADRNNKATLLLTGPFRTAKSSAKDLTPLVLKLQYAKYHDALRAPWKNRLLRR